MSNSILKVNQLIQDDRIKLNTWEMSVLLYSIVDIAIGLSALSAQCAQSAQSAPDIANRAIALLALSGST